MSKADVNLTEEDAKRLWDEYVQTHELPPGIPANPDVVYANSGWAGWLDWIGADVDDAEAGDAEHGDGPPSK